MEKDREKRQLKTNIPMCLACVLFCLTLITTHMTGGLYAKYAAGGSGNDSVRVAKFVVTEESTFFNETIEVTLSEPGTIENAIKIDNASEVAIAYTLQLENKTDNIPLQFAIGENTATTDTYTWTGNLNPGADIDLLIKTIWSEEGANQHIGKVDLVTITITAEQID